MVNHGLAFTWDDLGDTALAEDDRLHGFGGDHAHLNNVGALGDLGRRLGNLNTLGLGGLAAGVVDIMADN